ncbi:MAG: FtsX-like permease family protein [Bacteroidales bacterium]|jgi:putative ABC transport system permease protein
MLKYRKRGHSTFISTILNVLGLSIAFAAFYIIMVHVYRDFTYNKGIPDSDRVFIVSMPDWYTKGRYMSWLNRPIPEGIIKESPLIESGGTCNLTNSSPNIILFGADKDSEKELGNTNFSSFSKGAIKALGYEALSGSFENLSKDNFAISESVAEKTGLTVGSGFSWKYNMSNTGSVQQSTKNNGTIVCIYKNMSKNSDLGGIGIFNDIGDQSLEDFSEWSFPYFFKLRSAEDKETVEGQAFEYLFKIYGDENNNYDEKDIQTLKEEYHIRLTPLNKVYFDSVLNSPGRQGNKTTTLTLFIVAILVIVIAFINYLNFFFATVPIRMKSVNMRKILGSSRARLIFSFVWESVILVVISLAIAALTVYLFQDSIYANLVNANTKFSANIGMAAFTIGLGLIFAIIASIYPAFYITSFQPVLAIKGGFAFSAKGNKLRVTLIGLQFVISITLIICAVFVNMQRNWMINHNMGFNSENLLVCQTSNKAAISNQSVTSELKRNPDIIDVTWADGDIVSSGRMGWGRDYEEQSIYFQVYPVDWNFLRFMGINITEGRDFTKSDENCEDGVFIFNKTAKNQFDLKLEGKMTGHTNNPAEIIGFCEDFNFKGMQNKIQPFCFYLFGKNPWRANGTLYVRTAKDADIEGVITTIRNSISLVDPNIAKHEIDVKFFDSTIQSQYYNEKNLSRLINLFTTIAILISLIGVFGLVMFETEFRRKEIGIRRVNGATIGDILKMFNTKFFYIVLVCFIIASPLSWFLVKKYFEGFAYQMPIYIWVFLFAFLAVLIVTIAVVTLRSLRAATANPIKAIKTE